MDKRYIILALVYGVIFFDTLAAILYLRLRRQTVPSSMPASEAEQAPIPMVPRFEPATSMGEIHQRYAAMKETDPKRAGQLMYQEQLLLHGK